MEARQAVGREGPRASWIAAMAAAALVCFMVGVLAGVLATGGRPSDVFTVLRQPSRPATPAAATSGHSRVTVTSTVTSVDSASAPPPRTQTVTVKAPASTVRSTETVTETVTAPTTSGPAS